jgi:hypothetical protein
MARAKTAGQLKTTSKSQKTAWFRLWQFNCLNSFEFHSISGKVSPLISPLFMQIAFTSGDCFMNEILSNLAQDCHRILSETPGQDGREKIAKLLQNLLSDPANVETLVPHTTGERDLLYEDAKLGFCILAHNYDSPKTSPPHDHGPSWAIYAQARGQTEMRDYDKIEDASAEKAGKVQVSRTYRLTPGVAHVYNEGDLHSPTREGPTSLVRIEGTDMSKVKRFRYELA